MLSSLFSLLLLAMMIMFPNTVTGFDSNKGLGWKDVSFSGYDWVAKHTLRGRKGPGPNLYASGPDNVWVDEKGRLHLRITHRRNRWWCTEVVTKTSLGYGTYRFELEKLSTPLDDQVVLGLFTWDDDPAHFHREIDMEISTWGGQFIENSQFVVQPHHLARNKHRFHSPLTGSALVYQFEWTADKIHFQVNDGTSPISSWSYTGSDIPRPGAENARIALWLYKGLPPKGGEEVEVVVKRFEFIPIGP